VVFCAQHACHLKPLGLAAPAGWPGFFKKPALRRAGRKHVKPGRPGPLGTLMDAACAIETNETCSTYMYVSLGRLWSLYDVITIACIVVYFELAFEVLVPEPIEI